MDVRNAVEPRLESVPDLLLTDQAVAAGRGPRGVSKTQSSLKNDMIASTSWALNASSSAWSDGVAASGLDMRSPQFA